MPRYHITNETPSVVCISTEPEHPFTKGRVYPIVRGTFAPRVVGDHGRSVCIGRTGFYQTSLYLTVYTTRFRPSNGLERLWFAVKKAFQKKDKQHPCHCR